jgi:predicted DNA-binding transcriptional regulator AlpA
MNKKTFFLQADDIAKIVGMTERQVRDSLAKQENFPKPLPGCKPLRWPKQAVLKFLEIEQVDVQNG